MINVLIADDSLTFREMLTDIINRSDGMKVIGTATHGREAVEMAARLKPDMITMDVNMPRLNGIEATREIMRSTPCPILIVSHYRQAHNEGDVFEAMQAGALSVINKPKSPGSNDFDEESAWLIRSIRALSEVKVVTRKHLPPSIPTSKQSAPKATETGAAIRERKSRLIAIGASTGGPIAVKQLLDELTAPYPLPIVIVQHIALGFMQGLVDWLNRTTKHTIQIASDGEVLKPGTVYYAPDDCNLGLDSSMRVVLSQGPSEYGMRPSVSFLFKNIAHNHASQTTAILMTGMGADGAAELKILRDNGALTVIQDEESCVVFGMPGAARKLDAAIKILNPSRIAGLLNQQAEKQKND